MASTGTHWETVGKTSKKAKPHGQGSSHGKKKTTPDNMPRIEAAPPLKESATIYDAFLEKERKAQAKLQAEQQQQKSNAQNSSKKPTQPAKKKAAGGGSGDKKKEGPKSLEDAVTEIELVHLETVLEKDKALFPDNPSVWLLDLASLLNLKLENVPETDPVFEDKPQEYPMELLPKKIRALLLQTIHHCSTETLTSFAEHCMQSMISDIGKGVAVHGYRMFIQLLAYHKPDVILQRLSKYLEMVQSNKNRPLRCLAILWSVGQAGVRDLSKGLKVWLELMLPVLNNRALCSYGVAYLDNLLKIHSKQTTANGVIGFKNFFPIMDTIFNRQSPLPSQQQKKLMALYPRIKAISFGPHPESTLRNFFPSFLARLTLHTHKEQNAEVLRCLVQCLEQDPCCYGVWRNMYKKQLLASSELLKHLVAEWPALSKRLDRKQLKETLLAFRITNEELKASGKTSYDGYQRCVAAVNDLLEKMSRSRFPWRLLFFLILSACAGFIAYDVYTNKGFQKSKTNKFLVDSGILAILHTVWARVRVYGGKTAVWLEDNVPYYYARTCELVGPYLQLFWEKLYALAVYLAEVSAPLRAWIQKKIPECLEWMQAKWPGLYANIVEYTKIAWDFILHYSIIVWNGVVHYSLIAGAWLQENVFVGSFSIENIQKVAVSALVTLQEYITAFIRWLASLLASAMSDPAPQAAGEVPVKGR